MFRENIVNDGHFAIATYSATADTKTGCGVVIDETNKKFKVPAAETATDIFLLDKERIPTGRNAAFVNFSDYETEFVTVYQGDKGLLWKPYAGETFYTDQFDTTTVKEANIGKRLSVGTDGKWTVASSGSTSSVSSVYVLQKFYVDNGHTLAVISVSDTAAANS